MAPGAAYPRRVSMDKTRRIKTVYVGTKRLKKPCLLGTWNGTPGCDWGTGSAGACSGLKSAAADGLATERAGEHDFQAAGNGLVALPPKYSWLGWDGERRLPCRGGQNKQEQLSKNEQNEVSERRILFRSGLLSRSRFLYLSHNKLYRV